MEGQPERIQKVLAAAGYGSRRACEELVREGRVSVNGVTLDELPALVHPGVDQITVDGQRLRRPRRVYYLLHKPKGVLCTNYDPAGRVRAADLMHGVRERLFPVGRLDASSTGLLLMTNDGELAQRLTHPRYGVHKTYEATIEGRLTAAEVLKLRQGVWLAEGKSLPAEVKLLRNGRERSLVEVTLREGRNRQVRRMFARVGHKVLQLKRTHIGRLSLRGLAPGQFRPVSSTELKNLHTLSAGERPASSTLRSQATRVPSGGSTKQAKISPKNESGPGRTERIIRSRQPAPRSKKARERRR